MQLNSNRGAPAAAEIRNNSALAVVGTPILEEMDGILAKIDAAISDSFARQSVIFHSDATCQYFGDRVENNESSIQIRLVQSSTGATHLYTIPQGTGLPVANNGDVVYAIIDAHGAGTGTIPSTTLTYANGNLVSGVQVLPAIARANLFCVPILKRIDGQFSKRYVHWFFGHGVWVEGSQAQIGLAGSADDPVNTASLLSIRGENRWLSSKYEFYTDNVFARYQTTRIDLTKPYTAVLNDKQTNIDFAVSGLQFTTTNMADAEFLQDGTDIFECEVLAFWDRTKIDVNAAIQVSRDGGLNFQTMTNTRLGSTDLIYGTVYFPVGGPATSVNSYDTTNGFRALGGANGMFLSQRLISDSPGFYADVLKLTTTRVGVPVGSFRVSIVKDNGSGSPAAGANAIWASSQWVSAASISLSPAVIDYKIASMIPSGQYHIVIEADSNYHAAYTAVNNVTFAIDTSSVVTKAKSSNDYSTWTATTVTLNYALHGRILDLRVKVTSSVSNVSMTGLCVLYGSRKTIESGFINENIFTFATNQSQFVLDFIPDHRSLTAYVRGTGQVFRFGDFTISGNTVIFPSDFFTDAGTSNTIEFIQQYGYSIDTSDSNRALLRENALGSTVASLDMSQTGKGIKLRATNGTLVHAYLSWNGSAYVWVFAAT